MHENPGHGLHGPSRGGETSVSWNPGGQMAGRWATPDLRLHPQVDRGPLAWAGNCPSPGRLRATERALCPQRLIAWSTLCAVAQEAGRTGECGAGGRGRESLQQSGPRGTGGTLGGERGLCRKEQGQRWPGLNAALLWGRHPGKRESVSSEQGLPVPRNMSRSSQSGTRTSHLNFSEPQFLHLSKSRCMRFKSFLLR